MHMHEASQEGAGPPGRRANGAAAALGPHTKGARPAVTRGRSRRGRPSRGLGLRGGVPVPRPARAPRDTPGWLAARRRPSNRKCTPDLGWGLLCGLAGRPVGASGCRGQWGATLHATRGTVPVPPKADTRAPGLHKLRDQDLMSANPRIPRPELEGPLAWNRSGGPVLLHSALSALRFAFPSGEEISIECGVVQMGVQIEPQTRRLPGLAQKMWVPKL